MHDFIYYSAVISTMLVAGMISYQFIMAIGAFLNDRRMVRSLGRKPVVDLDQYPPVTILIPAHNEAVVIERTVETMLGLRYPKDKLTIMVINDASSDNTGSILDRLHEANPRVQVYHRHAPEGGRGKAAALNAAALRIPDDYIAIYDADNCPEPDSLIHLMTRFIENPSLAAAVGKFRCGNMSRNFLTRCVNIEGLCFQGIVQAGRHYLLQIAFLTGTNYVISKNALLAVGGWDEEALAEDSELSTRLYMENLRVDYVPHSQAWEQEPETMKVWMKQRTRWARGNNYAILKLIRNFGASKDKWRSLENLFVLSMSYLLLTAILISQTTLILALCGYSGEAPYAAWNFMFWPCSVFFFFGQIWYMLASSRQAQPYNLLAGLLMYFFYGYLWMAAIVRALYHDVVLKKARSWDKTIRFETQMEVGSEG